MEPSNPTPLTQLIRSETTVAGHRNLYCLHYDACLDVAVKLDWDSWSCEKCPLFKLHDEPLSSPGCSRTTGAGRPAPLMARGLVGRRAHHERAEGSHERQAEPLT